NLPSSLRITEKKNKPAKQRFSSKKTHDEKENSRKEESLNDDKAPNSGTSMLTVHDASFRKTEMEIRVEKQLAGGKCTDNIGKSNKGKFMNGNRAKSSGTSELTVSDKFPSFKKTEMEIRLDKSNKLIGNLRKSHKGAFVNDERAQNFDTHVFTVSEKTPSFRETEVEITREKQIFSDNSGNDEKPMKDDKFIQNSSGSTFMNKITEFPPRRISVMERPDNNNEFEKTNSSHNIFSDKNPIPSAKIRNSNIPSSSWDKFVEKTESVLISEKVPSIKPPNNDVARKEAFKENETGSNTDQIHIHGSPGRSSADQNELEQAVAFLTQNAVPESQECVKSPSQNNSDENNINNEPQITSPKDFAALWTQMSELFRPTVSQTGAPSTSGLEAEKLITSKYKAEKLIDFMNKMKHFTHEEILKHLERQK
ncbi:uncharacterized protein NPIL_375491, partial [Nephila pilipes]